METIKDREIKVIVGLGNPGAQYAKNRHNIGFMIIDELAAQCIGGEWQKKDTMHIVKVNLNSKPVYLVKPQTFMNDSGKIVPFLKKKGLAVENLLVLHDELEHPLGKITFKVGGSARGHNGLRSLMAAWGDNFARLRFGIGRPEEKGEVPTYVLSNFSCLSSELNDLIMKSTAMIEDLFD